MHPRACNSSRHRGRHANSFGQAQSVQSNGEFQRQVLPVLSKTCMSCHSDRLRTAGLSFESFRDGASASRAPDVWRKVLDKLEHGTDAAPSSCAALCIGPGCGHGVGIRNLPGISIESVAPTTVQPGRVTARRLNRAEYNNTIRDLLGVSLRPADEFPVDDSGYGFDNNGDVLSLSTC